MKVYNKNRDCDVIPDENAVSLDLLCSENLSLNDDNYDYDDELLACWLLDEELDFMFLISQMLLELREKFNVTTEVTRQSGTLYQLGNFFPIRKLILIPLITFFGNNFLLFLPFLIRKLLLDEVILPYR